MSTLSSALLIQPPAAKGAIAPKFNLSAAHCLTKDWIPAFVTLNAKVREALLPAEKYFLKEKSAWDVKKHLDAGMPMIGVSYEGTQTLAAAALLTFPGTNTHSLEEYPLDDHAVVQTFMRDPALNLTDVTERLYAEIDKQALSAGFTKLMAKIAYDNKGSQKSFEKKGGYERHSKAFDHKGGYLATFWTKQIGLNNV